MQKQVHHKSSQKRLPSMAGFATQLLLWLWLGSMGFLLARRILKTREPWLLLGSAIPIAMVVMLGVFFPLARLLGHPQGWVVGSLLLFVGTIVLVVRRDEVKAEPMSEFGFSAFQWGAFGSLLTAANLVMHTREAVGPEDDYWIHFPLISLLNRGEFPPPNPFFDDLALHGHFGRDYLVAVLGWYGGNGEALLSSLWSFNHILSVSAFFLAFGLGKRVSGTAGGFLMSCFLFFGISVGSRVGLMDTYDNNNLLVYCLLLLFVSFETTLGNSRSGDVFLALALGVYGIIYETHLLMFCMVLWVGPLLWRRPEGSLKLRAWLRPLAISVVGLLVAALLGGPLQDLTLRAAGLRKVKVDHAATYQAQRVRIKFPKTEFLKMVIGPESYRRISYVYQGKAFESLRIQGEPSGVKAREDFRYVFILGPEVLLMHWLALYLGLPAGVWLLRKRSAEAQVLWFFALISFLVPGLVDFGPVHEREYFRWQFAAGFGFAATLAAAMGLLWARSDSRWTKVLLVLLALLVCLGGERKVNRTLIEIERMPEQKRQRALRPWYPSPHDWILGSPELRVSEDLLEAALELRFRSRPQDRMLVDLDPRKHWDICQESTVAALAGLRSVGHVSPPPWMPDGIAPFFRSASWNAFWQTGDERILPFLNSRWLLCQSPENAKLLEGKENLKRIEDFGQVSLWRYEGELGAKTEKPPESVKVLDIERPTSPELLGEIALPMVLTLQDAPSAAFDLGVEWIPLPGTETGGPIEPLLLRCQPGSESYRHHLVAPLVEGRYRLKFTINGHPIETEDQDAVLEFDWSRQASLAKLKGLLGDTVEFTPESEFLVPPLRVGLRLYRLDESRYSKPFGFEAMGLWSGGEKVKLEPMEEGFRFDFPENVRGDIFLVDRSGREVWLEPLEAPGGLGEK